VEKQHSDGNYLLVNQVKIGVVKHFVKLGRLLFPRYFFYAVFSTVSIFVYLVLFRQAYTQESVFIMLFAAIVAGIFWYEAARLWSLKPF
jgi:hypothetical protein